MKEITKAGEIIKKAEVYFGGINEAISELEQEYKKLRAQESTGDEHSAAGFRHRAKIRGELEANGKALSSALGERQALLEKHRTELISESSAVWNEYIEVIGEQTGELVQAIVDKDKDMQKLINQINEINQQALSDYRAEVINPLNAIASSWRVKTGKSYIPENRSYTPLTVEGIIRNSYGK